MASRSGAVGARRGGEPRDLVVRERDRLQPAEVLQVAAQPLLAELLEVDLAHHDGQPFALDQPHWLAPDTGLLRRPRRVEPAGDGVGVEPCRAHDFDPDPDLIRSPIPTRAA